MGINELFYSLQGEGFLAGVPSVFIRIAGCPLRLSKEAGRQYGIDEIVQAVQQWPCSYVVMTGGEPMVESDLPQLAGGLKAAGKHITIETAGIAYIPEMPCDLMSISPKLSNSVPDEAKSAKVHNDSRLDIAVLEELIDNYNYQLKFVVDSEADLPEIEEILKKLPNADKQRVMLMPQAATRQELLTKSPIVAELCKRTGYAFSQRLQVMLWDNRKGH